MVQRTHAQKNLGQFLTPPYIGDLMASMFDELPRSIRMIDAGAGDGALTAAFVRRACESESNVSSIHATAYEIDAQIIPKLGQTLQKCEQLCNLRHINFSATINQGDFIQEASESLARNLFESTQRSFNVAIVNPPYKKIRIDSIERKALRRVGLETSNLYAGFVGLLVRLLEHDGQLVAITPRSFCNGPYFLQFRVDLLRAMSLRKLHVFRSREEAFGNQKVLQENIVFHTVKSATPSRTVIVSSSSGVPFEEVSTKLAAHSEIINPTDGERFIHIPAETSHADAKVRMAKLPATLAAIRLNVSTGPVVEFRLRQALRPTPTHETAPLIYPSHFHRGTVQWPKLNGHKPNAIVVNEMTRPWLVPSGLYVLTKRFSSKEERRRLVACVFDPAAIQSELLGFENHLNFIHARGAGLDRDLALGVFVFLNSTLVDHYFRCFSGHTQVNATDLRKLPFPTRETLRAIGSDLEDLDLSQGQLDNLLERHLHGI